MFSQNTIIHVFSNIFLTRYLSNEVKFAFSPYSAVHCEFVQIAAFPPQKRALIFTLQREYFPCLDNLHRQHLEVFLIRKPTPELNGIQKIQQRICAMCIVCSQKQRYISGYTGIQVVRRDSTTNVEYSKRFTLGQVKYFSVIHSFS